VCEYESGRLVIAKLHVGLPTKDADSSKVGVNPCTSDTSHATPSHGSDTDAFASLQNDSLHPEASTAASKDNTRRGVVVRDETQHSACVSVCVCVCV